jgi:general secretion pathway protein G
MRSSEKMMKLFRKKKRSSSKGFTLIELLIVVIILGILAAIVTIGVAGARNKSVEKSCQSSAVALASALDSFYIDNGEFPNIAVAGWYTTTLKADGTTPLTAAFNTYIKAIPALVQGGGQETVANAPTAGDYFLKISFNGAQSTVQGYKDIAGATAFSPVTLCKYPAA